MIEVMFDQVLTRIATPTISAPAVKPCRNGVASIDRPIIGPGNPNSRENAGPATAATPARIGTANMK